MASPRRFYRAISLRRTSPSGNHMLLGESESIPQTVCSYYPKHTRHSIAHLPNVVVPDDGIESCMKSKQRLSLSPLRGRKYETALSSDEELQGEYEEVEFSRKLEECAERKKGFWNWKAMRPISHIGMHRLSCIFSLYVDCIRGLSSSMNGLRLCVCLRKKESRGGAVCTTPARVVQGVAEFDETLHIKCHVYASSDHRAFQPRVFTMSVSAEDAKDLAFCKHNVDLSVLLHNNMDGRHTRGWKTVFDLSGKARGSQLFLGLGYDILDKNLSPSVYPRGSLSSRFKDTFSQRNRRISRSLPGSATATPKIPCSRYHSSLNMHLDSFDLDRLPPSQIHRRETAGFKTQADLQYGAADAEEEEDEDDFVVKEKGFEILKRIKEGEAASESKNKKNEDLKQNKTKAGGEEVKEVIEVLKQRRLSDLQNLSRQIDGLESSVPDNKEDEKICKAEILDAEEIDKVTADFLRMLEEEE